MSIETRLAEIRARVDAATEGPWENDGGGEIGQHWSRPEPWETIVDPQVSCMAYCYGGSAPGVANNADAEFIAASRTDLPTLLAAVEAVLKALDNLDSKHHFHGHECLCGFASARSRSRTEHLTAEVRSAITAELAQDTTREDPS